MRQRQPSLLGQTVLDQWLEGTFWVATLFVAYTYAVYPLAVALFAKLSARAPRSMPFSGSISIVLAARNEEATIARRIGELLHQLDDSGCAGELIIVSDGSTDTTVQQAMALSDERVRVIELATNTGKAAALSQGCATATGDVLAFADARQQWSEGALKQLLRSFSRPELGAVSGQLELVDAKGLVAGVGLYWRFERWLRRNEATLHSTVGVSGSICAVRRSLFTPIPDGTVLDDVYWPMQVVMQGYRVAFDEDAKAFDRLPEQAADEFRRKVRTLSGNFQLMARAPQILVPWRNPIWLQFLSHKLFRLIVPWAMFLILVSSLALDGPVFELAVYAQFAFYGLGLIGLLGSARIDSRITSSIGSFLILNAAAWLAFWVWMTGRTERSWSKVHYHHEPPGSNL